ncbi:MAG: glutamine synthetase [Paeniclostridium sordellii]|uniref:glutamine synthetase n=1 Tax=Paeniclostridium hominis TaxID=2764329 RepID=A0ABR7K3W4_9FIRM|nr:MULTISPECIES: glutamine synthetase [Paeniclostridium]MBC6003779.1 glutamine synthetase [Paeniclostridium hominis]MDU2591623.1 glutamine synthetase [Paeniclostridium sordellii]
MQSLLYVIKKENHNEKDLKEILSKHKNIMFVSLMGVDLGGNAIDEKIPMKVFLEDINDFLNSGIQTDGSSVELYNIATLNNAKVDLMPDNDAVWYIDYNMENICDKCNLPIGTLKIPSFLLHEGKRVCSRGILKKSEQYIKDSILEIIHKYPHMIEELEIENPYDIESINLTSATELEFWVNTPEDKVDLEALHVSQSLKEQYWKRTKGIIRTCLENSLTILQKLGLEPEMGHKEVGGITSSISIDGKTNHAMEQLEIDWKYSTPLQCADNELLAREVIEDVFSRNGLEVTFKAKPLDGVAGSGEHTHFGISAKLKNGKIVNLFSPYNMTSDYTTKFGYGALMGILKNYEVLNPFVTSSNDGFNRLVPGFEAPVCIVTSLGHTYELPSRNRSILVGLIRDINSPLSTRFELRSPNPLSNTYLVIAGAYQTILHGIKAVAESKLSTKDLEKELSKEIGEDGFYLEKDRSYRDENDVFEDYSIEERNQRFSIPPATVYENMKNLEIQSYKIESLIQGDVFTEKIINSFKTGAIDKWKKELKNRIIQDNIDIIRSLKKLHDTDDMNTLDEVAWDNINNLKHYLMKDTMSKKSLFTQIKEAIESKDYELASKLQIEMKDKMKEVQHLYIQYQKNIF